MTLATAATLLPRLIGSHGRRQVAIFKREGWERLDRARRRTIRGYPMWLVAGVATVLLVLPWVMALAHARHHNLDAAAVGILATVSIPCLGCGLRG